MSLARSLRLRNQEVVLMGNRKLDDEMKRQTSVLPVFTYLCEDAPISTEIDPRSSEGMQLVRSIQEESVEGDLLEADGIIHFSPDDVVIFNTFRHWGLRGIVRWLEKLGPERAPFVAIVLHYTSYSLPEMDEIDNHKFYREAFSYIEESPVRQKIVMMADSEGLIDEFRTISNLDFLLAPIPHAPNARSESGQKYFPQNVPLNISYLGEAREPKGFQFLPFAINGIERSPWAGHVHFHIQNFCKTPNEQYYLRAMGKMAKNHATFYPKQFGDAEYKAFLEMSDIILIPYIFAFYYVQTSGVYAEAASMGKPVVVPMGTWMASQVKQFGGGRLFPPGDVQGFLDACLDVVSNFKNIRIEAMDASKKWNAIHNADRMIDLILEKVYGAQR